MSTFTLEERYRLWNDGCGVRVEIGDDPDGLLIKALQRRLAREKENTCENLPKF